MGKVMMINREYVVKKGILKGFKGILVGYIALTGESLIKIDEFASIEISSEFLELVNA